MTGRLATTPVRIWPGSRRACGSRRTWPPPSATTGQRGPRAVPAGHPGPLTARPETAARYAAEEQAARRQAPLPTLYLHGAADGCIRVELARGAERLLAPSSRMVVIENAGHFLHLEKPGEVNEHILAWISS